MHALNWTRTESVEYFLDHIPMEEGAAWNEINRYVIWPGQALGYKLGQLKFQELKEKAQAQLKEDFDLRQFHSLVLSQGPLSLNMLEEYVLENIS